MKLNSHNLVMSAMFGGRHGPRPPVGNPTSIACHGLMERAGVFFPEAHLNPNAMAELALAGHEIVGFDTVMPEYSVVQEAAALGARIDWGDRDKMPDVREFPNADFSDIVMPSGFPGKAFLPRAAGCSLHFASSRRRSGDDRRKGHGPLDHVLPHGRHPELPARRGHA